MADEKETRIDFIPEPEAPVTGSTPELERDPNSSNLFYVEPENIVYDVDAGINAKIEIVSEGENLGTYNFDTVDSDQLPSIHFTIMEDVVSGLGPFFFWVESYLVDQEAFTAIEYGSGVGLDANITGVIITLGERETNDTGDYYGYFVDYTDASPLTFVFPFSHNVTMLDNVKIGLTSVAETDPELYWWESAYRKFEIDLDPIFSSKLITVGQLSRLTGSGTASGAQADKLLTMGQLARLTGKQTPAEDKKGKLVTVGQAYSVV